MNGKLTPEYVESLRREGQRKGARIRELETILAEVRAEFVRITGREPTTITETAIGRRPPGRL